MRYGSRTDAGVTVEPSARPMPAAIRGLGDARLGSVDDPVLSDAGEPSVFIGLAGLGLAALGGAFTGYVAAGDGQGALTGAAVHTTLVGFGATVASVGQLAPWKTITYGIVALGAGIGAGYLFMKRKRKRRR